MKATHFTSGSYITVRTDAGTYSFLGKGTREMIRHQSRLAMQIARAQRQLAAVNAFLDGESECNSEALHERS
jgi:hypothetical protein